MPPASPALNSIDDYERLLSATLEGWVPERRVAWAAAMAERWLHIYEAFSAREKWGDPASLHRTVDAIWAHALGRTLAAADRARHAAQLRDSTPHMDDFDAEDALAACMVVREALECCATADNVAPAIGAALSAFEAVVPDWELDPRTQPRLWRRLAIRKELRKQLKVLDLVAAIAQLDEQNLQSLRRKLTGPAFAGEVAQRRESETYPAAVTNQAAFEQYRLTVEADLRDRERQRPMQLDLGPAFEATLRFAEWANRYSRRQVMIDGSFGTMADWPALRALVVRERIRDAAVTAAPGWDPEVRERIDMCLRNPLTRFDARSVEELHGFGPSIRRLWAEAIGRGESDEEAWNSIVAWARHRPMAWVAEDRRKKKGLVRCRHWASTLLVR
jgi:uncharacterized protein YjaG (DUF416 family)